MVDYWMIILATILGSLLIYYFFIWENVFLEHGVPHRKPLLGFGNFAKVLFKKRTFMDDLVITYNLNDDAKYVGYFDFHTPSIIIRDLELIKDIAVKHFDHFIDHRTFGDPDVEPLLGGNLFSLCGNEWRRIRNLLSPAFTSSKIKGMFKLMSKCAENFCVTIHEQCGNESLEYDSRDIFTRYTADVIASCAFGISVDSIKNPDNEFFVLGKRATNFGGIALVKFLIVRSFPRLAKMLHIKLIDKKSSDFFHRLVRETVETRDQHGIYRPDMIQLMMETRGNNSDSKTSELTIEDMTAHAFIFFFGGFDTTATTLCFVAHQLAMYPDVQKKLQDEIDQVMESCNGEPTYEAVSNMGYIDAVINESMRMYPVGFINDRICTKSFELPPSLPNSKPLMVKPGDVVWFGIWPIHRDPKYFAHPDEFDPERFIVKSKADFNSHAFMPFGIGPRMCIANRFAMLEIKVLLLHLLAKFNITLGSKTILPMRLVKSAFELKPEGGFWLNLIPRETSI